MEKQINVKISANTTKFKSQMDKAIETLEDFKNVTKDAEDTDFKNVSKQMNNITDATKDATKAVENTVDAIKDLSDINTKSAVNSLNNIQDAVQDVQNTAQDASNGINELNSTINDVRCRTLQSISRNLNNIDSAASDATSGSNKLKSALRRVTPGGIDSVTTAANEAEEALNDAANSADTLKDAAKSAIGAIAAAGTINEVISKSLESANLDTKINVGFNIDDSSKKIIKETVYQLEAYGIEAEEALEASRKQWALNKNATDEYNQSIIKSASTIASAYGDIDLNELIQETNEIGKSFKITDKEALALVDHLLEIGFPTDQLDIISEYGSQLKRAGFDAKQIQAIFASGVDTGTWNVDILCDGLKEARIVMAEFAVAVDSDTASIIKKAGQTSKQFQQWGKDIASGGEKGAKSYQEMCKWIASIEDPILRNQVGTKVFGTLFEENGDLILDTVNQMDSHLSNLVKDQDALNQKTKELDADPAIKMGQAIGTLKTTLQPVLGVIADVVSAIAGFISQHPKMAAAIAAVAAAITIIIGTLGAIAPIVTAAVTVMSAGFSIPLIPIMAIVAAIAAVIGIGVALCKNWDTIKSKAKGFASELSEGWTLFKSDVSRTLSELGQEFSQMPGKMKQIGADILNGIGEGIKSKLGSITSWCGEIKDKIVNGIKNLFGIHSPSTVMADEVGLNLITGIGKGVIDNIGKFFDMVGGIKDKVVGFFKDLFGKNESTPFENLDATKVKELESALNSLNKTAQSCNKNLSTAFNGLNKSIRNTCVSSTNIVRNQFTNISNIVKNQATNARNGATTQFISLKKVISTQISEARQTITSKMLSISKVVNAQSSAARNNATRNFISLAKVVRTQMANAYSSVSSYMNKIKSATNRSLTTKINVVKSVSTIKSGSQSLSANLSKLGNMATNRSLNYALSSTTGISGVNSTGTNDISSKSIIIHNYMDIDGKTVAKSTAKYMPKELDELDKKNNRKRGTK